MSERIYENGRIFALDATLPADYLLCKDGKIVSAGRGEPPPLSAGAERVDLKGGALLPAFIDSHSHLSAVAHRLLQLSLDGLSGREVLSAIARFIRDNNPEKGEWISAGGYEPEGGRLTAKQLDAVSPSHPLVLQYPSGHMGIFNSAALRVLGVDADTPPSEGGFIEKDADGNPTGYMEENDFVSRLKKVPPPAADKLLAAFGKAQDIYFSHGVVLIQEGVALKELLPLYLALREKGLLKADVVLFPDLPSYPEYAAAFPEKGGKLRVGGVKLISDGSPQGRTAWLRQPYLDEEGNPDKSGYCGYPAVTREVLEEHVLFCAGKGLQLLVHCNGDRAADAFIDAQLRFGKPETRPVMIHAQMLPVDRLDDVRRAGIIPSFFVAHVGRWGDVHLKNLGERAQMISPLRSALDKGIPFTLHQDSPVLPPDMLYTVCCAAERRTQSGRVLGERERIDVLSALRAVTRNAAYQYFEENSTGGLRRGMRENLVLLSDDPFRTPHDRLPEIRVERTILDGKTVFCR